jgi:hypothetical protein
MSLAYNEPITFGRSSGASQLTSSGIDFSEDTRRSWTSTKSCDIEITLPPARQDVTIQITASPFGVPEHLPAQQVFVFLGGLFVGFWWLRDFETVSFPIARANLTGRPTRLSLVVPTALSPSSLSLNEDERDLGISLQSITFLTK